MFKIFEFIIIHYILETFKFLVLLWRSIPFSSFGSTSSIIYWTWSDPPNPNQNVLFIKDLPSYVRFRTFILQYSYPRYFRDHIYVLSFIELNRLCFPVSFVRYWLFPFIFVLLTMGGYGSVLNLNLEIIRVDFKNYNSAVLVKTRNLIFWSIFWLYYTSALPSPFLSPLLTNLWEFFRRSRPFPSNLPSKLRWSCLFPE